MLKQKQKKQQRIVEVTELVHVRGGGSSPEPAVGTNDHGPLNGP